MAMHWCLLDKNKIIYFKISYPYLLTTSKRRAEFERGTADSYLGVLTSVPRRDIHLAIFQRQCSHDQMRSRKWNRVEDVGVSDTCISLLYLIINNNEILGKIMQWLNILEAPKYLYSVVQYLRV